MRTANRVRQLLESSPLHHLNSLLLQEAGRYRAAVDAQAAKQGSHRIWMNEDCVTFEVDLPGHAIEDFQVSLDKDVISIEVKGSPEDPETDSRVYLKERNHVGGTLQLQLPFRADPGQIETTYARGILKIIAQRPAEDLPRQLEIKAAE